jgi:hypothetical protein
VGFYHIPARRAWAKVAGGGTIGHSSSYAEATEDEGQGSGINHGDMEDTEDTEKGKGIS